MMRRILPAALVLLWLSPALAETVYASRVIRPGEIIASSDLRIDSIANSEATSLLAALVGTEAKVMLYADRPIRVDHTRPPTLVSRNQLVALIFDGSGLRIEVEGRAMERGSLGDSVKVMNIGSRRTVVGTVLADGNVLVGGLR